MSNNGFTLLWSKILDSSVWMQDGPTRLVWITILAMKNADGVVKAAVPGLAHRARVTVEECRKALAIFLAPDPDSSSKEHEGRRLLEIPGGWQVINHEVYRYSTEASREFWRQQKAKQREKKSGSAFKRGKPLPGEESQIKQWQDGYREDDGLGDREP